MNAERKRRPSHVEATHIEALTDAVQHLAEELRALRMAVDELRSEFQWAVQNGIGEFPCWKPDLNLVRPDDTSAEAVPHPRSNAQNEGDETPPTSEEPSQQMLW